PAIRIVRSVVEGARHPVDGSRLAVEGELLAELLVEGVVIGRVLRQGAAIRVAAVLVAELAVRRDRFETEILGQLPVERARETPVVEVVDVGRVATRDGIRAELRKIRIQVVGDEAAVVADRLADIGGRTRGRYTVRSVGERTPTGIQPVGAVDDRV